MAAPFTFKLEGADKVLSALKNLPVKIKKEIKAEIEIGGQNIVNAARSDAAADQGLLRNGITSYPTGDLQVDIVSAADYSAFLEFGTRTKIRIPPGAEQFASQYRSRSDASSLGAKEAIKNWCKRKGIENWYPVYISIMVKGIEPKPFFFHNFFIEKPKLIRRIKNILVNP